MIPRFKPPIGAAELTAAMRPPADAVDRFEREFAQAFEAGQAVSFSYGRSALWALFKALGIKGGEVVVPAYTCVVVPHAIVLSGNTCRFVDVTLRDYNMDLEEMTAAINERTRAIVATHLFGYPLDCDRLRDIVRSAEATFGRKIYVIHDCAHAFGARWKGRLVCNEGDAALFGLGVSKLMTSVFGGAVTSHDRDVIRRLREFRERTFHVTSATASLGHQLYLAAVQVAFSRPAYGMVRWIEAETPLLDRLTKAYHLDDIIHFPPDYLEQMTAAAASVGLVQLKKYPAIVDAHIGHAKFYDARLRGAVPWALPPIVDGATYSHYVIRVPDRASVLRQMIRRGVELGELIQYSVPHMAAYASAETEARFPHSREASAHTINLPVHAGLSADARERVADACLAVAAAEHGQRQVYAAG